MPVKEPKMAILCKIFGHSPEKEVIQSIVFEAETPEEEAEAGERKFCTRCKTLYKP